MTLHSRRIRSPQVALLAIAVLCARAEVAKAYTVSIGTGTRMVYLRVGDGSMVGGNYSPSGTPAINTIVNQVSVTVPAAAVGDNVARPMTATGRLTSDFDGVAFCTPGQVYIGAFYRINTNNSQSATLQVSAPSNLSTTSGDTIPISQISWTSSGIGDIGAQPFPAGSFTGGTQTIANLLRNTWAESCHSFSYANTAIRAAGTYNARATYTLSTP